MQQVEIGGQRMILTTRDVYYGDGVALHIDEAARSFLRREALASPRQQCRICLHAEPEAPLHEMLIAQTSAYYSRPHRHLRKTEAYLFVEGAADLVSFADDGTVAGVTPLTASGLYYARMQPLVWHALRIRSELVLYHEIAPGPFDPSGSEFAPWAPADADAAERSGYHAELDAALAHWQAG